MQDAEFRPETRCAALGAPKQEARTSRPSSKISVDIESLTKAFGRREFLEFEVSGHIAAAPGSRNSGASARWCW